MSLKLEHSPPRPRYARAQLREIIHNIHLKVRPSAKRPMSRRPCCRRRRGVVTQRPARTKISGTSFSFGEGKWSVKNLWPSGCWFCYCLSMWESLRSLLCTPNLRCNFLHNPLCFPRKALYMMKQILQYLLNNCETTKKTDVLDSDEQVYTKKHLVNIEFPRGLVLKVVSITSMTPEFKDAREEGIRVSYQNRNKEWVNEWLKNLPVYDRKRIKKEGFGL